ncbi:MAG: pilus assembly protein PilW [Acinetobacter sp. GWC1_38_13]|uniref:PilW family protein n=1 Tax=Acinetobacter sp. GWC1_38_13 TaxID=1797234 RepID=UPI0008B82D9D|nr:PilW family protein [Acinetobacter sp. GWC1_38_13]OFW45291.1 MAG: pilus assembly protein PilW [Acinetobacter sp. GWC1_38_13]HAV56453.1 pilus assembly protein PilW [Acinetobacter junii]
MNRKQLGFTLIELMISLTLGLIITAAAVLLFVTGQRSAAMQKGVAELQDNANFGLNYMTKDIRMSNLNIKTAEINDATLYGGVVLTTKDSTDVQLDTTTSPATQKPTLPLTITLANALVSQSDNRLSSVGTGNHWTGISNVENTTGTALRSDQLVVQYLPQYIIDNKGTTSTTDDQYVGGFDCEGNEIRFSAAENLRIYVQRYFLREDDNHAANETSPLALACDAGYYAIGTFHGAIAATGTSPAIPATIPATAPTSVTNYGDAGEIIIKRVDQFRVLLGVQKPETDTSTSTPVTSIKNQYISIKDYMALTAPRPRILSIQLGMLVRSTQSVGNESAVKADQQFTVLDQIVKVKTSTDPKYIRQVISQTVALRNALGERE